MELFASWSNQNKCILKMSNDVGIIYVNIRNSSDSKLAYRITLKNKKETHIESIIDINIDYYNYVYKMPIGCSQAIMAVFNFAKVLLLLVLKIIYFLVLKTK